MCGRLPVPFACATARAPRPATTAAALTGLADLSQFGACEAAKFCKINSGYPKVFTTKAPLSGAMGGLQSPREER